MPLRRTVGFLAALGTAMALGVGSAHAATPPPSVAISPGGHFTVGTTLAYDGGIPLTFTWRIDAPAGVCRERVTLSDDVGMLAGFDVASRTPPTSFHFRDPATGSYSNGEPGPLLQVAVTDCLGRSGGAWTFSHAFKHDDTEAVFSRGWSIGHCSCWYGGSNRRSAAAGQRATFTTTGRGNGFALLGDHGPGRGTADIYVDGRKSRSINTAAAIGTDQMVVWQTHFQARADHVITIVVTKGRVDVDGLIVSQSNVFPSTDGVRG